MSSPELWACSNLKLVAGVRVEDRGGRADGVRGMVGRCRAEDTERPVQRDIADHHIGRIVDYPAAVAGLLA